MYNEHIWHEQLPKSNKTTDMTLCHLWSRSTVDGLSPAFFLLWVGGNCLGNNKTGKDMNNWIVPIIKNPSHQAPNQRTSLMEYSGVWNIEIGYQSESDEWTEWQEIQQNQNRILPLLGRHYFIYEMALKKCPTTCQISFPSNTYNNQTDFVSIVGYNWLIIGLNKPS